MEDAKPVIQIPVGLPCLEKGALVKKVEKIEKYTKNCLLKMRPKVRNDDVSRAYVASPLFPI